MKKHQPAGQWRRMISLLAVLPFVLSAAAGLAADSDRQPVQNSVPKLFEARSPVKLQEPGLRPIHLSPDAPAVDIWVNGTGPVLTGLEFQQSSVYLTLPVGTYTFDIVPAGGALEDSVLTIPDLALSADTFYTAAAFDALATIQPLALVDDLSPVSPGNIRLRAVHTAYMVGEVDIWLIPEMGDPVVLWENLGFGGAGSYLEVPSAEYLIGFDVNDDGVPDVLFDIPALAADSVANVFAVQDTNGALFLLVQLADGTIVRLDPRLEPASVRAIHLSPDAPAVDVWVNGTGPVLTNLEFQQGSAYLTVPPGTYTFDIVPAGGALEDSVLTIPDLALSSDTFYTAAAFDALATIQPLALVDDLSSVPANFIRFRAIHTAYMVGEVDIWVIPGTGDPVLLWENLGFGDVGSYLEVPSAEYLIGFDVNDDGVADVLFDLPALTAGTVANVFAAQETGGALFLLAQLADGTIVRLDPRVEPASVRAIHLSPDAPAVDVWVNGTGPVLTNLAFQQGSAYLTVPPGTYTFDIVPAGGALEDSVLTIPDLALSSDMFYTAAAFDALATIQPLALVDDLSSVPANFIRFRAIHTAYMVGEVDIWVIPGTGDPVLLWENLGFGDVGSYLEVPSAEYLIGFDVNDDGVADVLFDLPALTAGTVANVFAAQETGGALFLLAQLADGTIVRLDPRVEPASVRAIHLSPDAPAVDVWVNGTGPVLTNLAFQQGSAYLTVPPGTYTFDIVPAGGALEDSVLTIPGIELMENQSYTVAAYDALTSLQAMLLIDFVGPGDNLDLDLKYRAVHTAVGVGEVDIWNVPAMGDPSMLWMDLGFGEAGNYLSLDPQAYTVGIDVNNDMVPDLLFDVPALPVNTIANVFAVSDGLGQVFLLAQLQDSSVARIDARTADPAAKIRVLHLSPDAPAVDIWVDGVTLAFSSVDFQEGTAYAELPPGTYTFSISPAGAGPGASVLDVPYVMLDSGVCYTVAAYDYLASLKAMALVDESPADPPLDGEFRLRAVHAAAGVGAVDIWNIPAMGDPAALWTDLGFGSAGAYLTLASMAYTIGFDVDNDMVPDVLFDVPALPENTVASAFAVADSMGAVFLLAQLDDSSIVRIDAREPSCDALGVQLEIPMEYVSPGDTFFVEATVCNPDALMTDVPFFALLDVGIGEYWFYPSWAHYPPDVDYAEMDLPTGETVVEVIPAFTWPDTGHSAFSGIIIYGALLNQEMTAIIGDLGMVTFGYGPAR